MKVWVSYLQVRNGCNKQACNSQSHTLTKSSSKMPPTQTDAVHSLSIGTSIKLKVHIPCTSSSEQSPAPVSFQTILAALWPPGQ